MVATWNNIQANYLEYDYLCELVSYLDMPIWLYSQDCVGPEIECHFTTPTLAIVISDESYRPTKLSGQVLIFKNYVVQESHNLKRMPLPITNGFKPQPKPIRDRKYLFSFTGQLNPSRQIMKSVLDNYKSDRCYLRYSDGFSSGLSKEEYSDLMSDTIYALCPFGGCYETFRYNEAIMAGCIPISLQREWYWYDSPCTIKIDGWWRLPSILNNYDKYNAEQWSEYNLNHYNDILSPKSLARRMATEWTNFMNTCSKHVVTTK